jgi:hypothetical protein
MATGPHISAKNKTDVLQEGLHTGSAGGAGFPSRGSRSTGGRASRTALTKTPCVEGGTHPTFPEYHTSTDNLDFIQPAQLAGSLRVCAAILDVLENNRRYRSQNPYCEPQLGRRNLYRSTGGGAIGVDISAPVGIKSLRWGALATGYCGALRHPIFGDQRRGRAAVPERLVVMRIASLLLLPLC